MDFRAVLTRASEQQGVSAVPKRYSLAVGPPKKDPKVKGVQSAAVQAFLKKREEEEKKKVLMEKRRKEELLAKRVELKHDRKARAMASRTKDNFCGYNGIPIEEKPRRRQSHENSSARSPKSRTHDEMNQVAYNQSESEEESEEYEEKPSKFSEKPKVLPRSAPPAMNFSDLLKLAEKKQYEPVEIKIVKKTEERPMTAEELRERDYLEKRNRKEIILKEKKSEKEMKYTTASGSFKKEISQRDLANAQFSKHSTDKPSFSKGSIPSQNNNKKSKGPVLSEKLSKLASCSTPSHIERIKSAPKGSLKSPPNSNHIKPAPSGGGKTGSKSHAVVLKTAANGALRQSSSKEHSLKKNSIHTKSTSVASTQQQSYKNSSSKQASSNAVTGGSLARSKSSLNTGPEQPSSSLITRHGSQGTGPRRSENSSGQGQRSSNSRTGPRLPGNSLSMGSGRPNINSGPGCLGSSQGIGPGRPNAIINTGLGRGSSSGPGRPSTTSAGTLKPKCTVVSETISSKNLVPRQANAQMNGMRPFSNQRPGITPQGFPRPSLPPISYKRKFEDEDEDESEMEDFIDDEGESQEEISKHIREIFGYDRSRYKDESDYALRYMESSWKEQQKEEARSLRLGMQEDLEELKREEEELKHKKQAKKLRTH